MFKKAFVISVSMLAAACGSNNSTSFGDSGGSGGVAASGGSGGTAASGGSAGVGTGGAAGSGVGGSGATAGTGGTAGTAGSGLEFTELMINPKKVTDELGEYVELYNSGTSAIDLKGYKLYDDYSNSHVIASDVTVAPGAYVVLARAGDVHTNGGVQPDYVYDNFFLANTADQVLLDDPSGKRVAQVEYDTANGWPAGDGAAIELTDLSLDPTLPSSWALAKNRFGTGDLGTPGGPNGYGPTPYQLDANDLGWQDPSLGASMFFSYFDNTEQAILKAIASAKTSIHLAMFDLRQSSIITALGNAKKAGVDVTILLDQKQMDQTYNQPKIQEMQNAGLTPVGVSNTKATDATMHDKFMVIDGARVLTGSMNYSSNALTYSDEDLLVLDDASAAQLYETEFAELQAGTGNTATAATSAPLRVEFGPEDKLPQIVAAELQGAQSSVYLAMFQLNNQSLIDELVAAKQRGVHVVVILDKVQANSQTEDEQLDAAGIKVFRFENQRGGASNAGLVELHNKLCVIDGTTVLMGSYNWTNLASYYNDENLVLLTSPLLATQGHREMAQLLNDYLPGFQPSDGGFAAGTRSVTLSVRGLTVDAGAEVLVSGTISDLGDDNFALAVPLTAKSGGTWETTVSLPAGSQFDYQVLVRSKLRHNYADPTGARSFTVPYASGAVLSSQAFGKRLD